MYGARRLCPSRKREGRTGRSGAPGIALYALDCGRIVTSDAGPFSDDHAYDGQTRELVDPCYLIRHPRGDLLWDAGFPEAVAAMPQGLTNDTFHITLARQTDAQLAEIGVQPKDIELFSVSHSHPDHVGNANLFAGATWIVDRDERDYMLQPGSTRRHPGVHRLRAARNGAYHPD